MQIFSNILVVTVILRGVKNVGVKFSNSMVNSDIIFL